MTTVDLMKLWGEICIVPSLVLVRYWVGDLYSTGAVCTLARC